MLQKSKEKKIATFNPSGQASKGNNLFSLPFDKDESDIIILPVPWEVTVSYKPGTAKAPEAVMDASMQIDLFDSDVPGAWKRGIYMLPVNQNIKKESKKLRPVAAKIIDELYEGEEISKDKALSKQLKKINDAGEALKNWVAKEATQLLKQNKLVGLLGGDHSTPLGLMEAVSKIHPEFGVLHIDAHSDLRDSYEGFTYSHASIMFNALKISQIKKLVQVGIRDLCEEEVNVINQSNGRVKTFFDAQMKRDQFNGQSWKNICDKIVTELPQKVYISFDIDGLDPKLCPNTGTPVAGGLEFEQAVFLLIKVVESGRKIIGFDLNEVSPGKDEWDANVGARMLYKLCNLMGKSNS